MECFSMKELLTLCFLLEEYLTFLPTVLVMEMKSMFLTCIVSPTNFIHFQTQHYLHANKLMIIYPTNPELSTHSLSKT